MNCYKRNGLSEMTAHFLFYRSLNPDAAIPPILFLHKSPSSAKIKTKI